MLSFRQEDLARESFLARPYIKHVTVYVQVLNDFTTLTVCSNGTPAALMVLQPTDPEGSQATPADVETAMRSPTPKATVTPVPAALTKSATQGSGNIDAATATKKTSVSGSVKRTEVEKNPDAAEGKPRSRAELKKLQVGSLQVGSQAGTCFTPKHSTERRICYYRKGRPGRCFTFQILQSFINPQPLYFECFVLPCSLVQTEALVSN